MTLAFRTYCRGVTAVEGVARGSTDAAHVEDAADAGDAAGPDEACDAAPRRRVPLGSVLHRAVGAVTVLIVLGVVLAPRMSLNTYDPVAAGVGLVVVVAGWQALAPLVAVLGRAPRRRWDAVAVVLCALLVAVAGFFAYFGAYRTGWDAAMVKYAVTQPADEKVVGAFSAYPNLRPFVAVARTVYGWTAGTALDYDAGFAVLNTVSFLVAAVAVYLTVRLVAGPVRAVLALLLLGALLGTSQWLSVAYTDMAALWVPITAVCLVIVALRSGTGPVSAGVLAGAGGVVLAAGYLIKTTPVVGLPALLAAIALAVPAGATSRLRLAAIAACAVAAFLVALPVLGIWVRATEDLPPLRENVAATPLTYVAAGMRTQAWTPTTTAYGAWDREVMRRTKGQDAAIQDAVARQMIEQEWERRGFGGMAAFAVDKTLFNWGDGTFWARGEGADQTNRALREGPWAEAVHAWNTPGGSVYGLHVLLAQVAWTATLLGVGVGLLASRPRPELMLMVLTVVGIAAFTLVFQGRSRYLIGHVPVVVALAACVVPRPRLPRGVARRARRPVRADAASSP